MRREEYRILLSLYQRIERDVIFRWRMRQKRRKGDTGGDEDDDAGREEEGRRHIITPPLLRLTVTVTARDTHHVAQC